MQKHFQIILFFLKKMPSHLQIRFAFLSFYSIINATFEIIGITLIFPLIALVSNPTLAPASRFYKILNSYFNFISPKIYVLLFAITIAGIFIFKNLFTIWYQNWQFKLLKEWQLQISTKIFTKYLELPFIYSLKKNSSQQISLLNNIIYYVINSYILQISLLFSNTVIILFFCIYLFTSYLLPTLISGGFLLTLMLIQNKIIKKTMLNLGKEFNFLVAENQKILHQSLGSLKETKLTLKEQFFINQFINNSRASNKNDRKILVFRYLPTSTTEIILISAVITMSCILIFYNQAPGITAVSDLAVLTMCAFRLAPLLNRSLSCLTEINGTTPSAELLMEEIKELDDINLSEQQLINPNFKKNINFENIILKKVNFNYPDSSNPDVKDLNLHIKKNSYIGIIGRSGSGKTTLIDILLGLLPINSGTIEIDSHICSLSDLRALRKIVGYVNQNSAILDASIKENIAFGEPLEKIDHNQVIKCLKTAQLIDFVNSLPKNIETKIAENGKNLSGGQCQRIMIARALYRNPKLLIFDEATSALDMETEHAVIECLKNLKGKITIIAIAHRLSTLKYCDNLVYMENGEILHQGSWDELKKQSSEVARLFELANLQ